MRPRFVALSILVLSLVISLSFLAPRSGAAPQDPPTPPAGGGGQDRPGRPEQSPEPKPYDRVITKDAKSDQGIFTVHSIKDKSITRSPRANSTRSFSG